MTLYISKHGSVSSFPVKQVVKNITDFHSVVENYNYCFAEFRPGKTQGGVEVEAHRAYEDWVRSDCLYADFDDGYSIGEFMNKFDGFEYYIATSKSHQKLKNGKIVDRFHAIFPIDEIDDVDRHKGYLRQLGKLIKGLDKNCVDSVRYFAPAKGCKVFYNKGRSIQRVVHKMWLDEPEEEIKEEIKLPSSYNRLILNKLDVAYEKGWFDEYAAWTRLGMALKAAGFEVEDWKRYCFTKEDEKEAEYKWKGFSDSHNKINKNYLLDLCGKVHKYYK